MDWGITKAPELMEERANMASNIKSWDKVVDLIYTFVLIE